MKNRLPRWILTWIPIAAVLGLAVSFAVGSFRLGSPNIVRAASGSQEGTVTLPTHCSGLGEAATVTFCATNEPVPYNWSVDGAWITDDGRSIPFHLSSLPEPTGMCQTVSFELPVGCDDPSPPDLVAMTWTATTDVVASLDSDACTNCVPDGFNDYGSLQTASCAIAPMVRQFHLVLDVSQGADSMATLLNQMCPDTPFNGSDIPCPGRDRVLPCGTQASSPVTVLTSQGEVYARGWRSSSVPSEFHFVVDSPVRNVTGYKLASNAWVNGEPTEIEATAQSYCEVLAEFRLNIKPRLKNFNNLVVPWLPKTSPIGQNPCPNGNGQWAFHASFDYGGQPATIDLTMCGLITLGSHAQPWRVRYRCRNLMPLVSYCDVDRRQDYTHFMIYAPNSAGQVAQSIAANAFDPQKCANSPIDKMSVQVGQCSPVSCSPCNDPIDPITNPTGSVSGDAIIEHVPGCDF